MHLFQRISGQSLLRNFPIQLAIDIFSLMLNLVYAAIVMVSFLFLEVNTTMETIIDEEEDILYQKDASISAELDENNDVRGNSVMPSPGVEEVEKKVQFVTTQSPNLEQKVPGSTGGDGHTTESLRATDMIPCLLDCGVGGTCTTEPLDSGRPGQQRCQCPLGRGGSHCDLGKPHDNSNTKFVKFLFKMCTSKLRVLTRNVTAVACMHCKSVFIRLKVRVIRK